MRSDDINTGIDRVLISQRRLQGIGLPENAIPDPMNGGKVQDRPAVRFNPSMLCSFSRSGEVTNGSIVVSDGIDAAIIRNQGKSGRVSVLHWDGRRWKKGA